MQRDPPTRHDSTRPSPTGNRTRKELSRPPLRRHSEVTRSEYGSLVRRAATVDCYQENLSAATMRVSFNVDDGRRHNESE